MTNDKSLSELKYFISSTTIPKIKIKPKTFLGIAKQPHYENVITNMYAFFFNVNEEHGLKNLFIKTLIECINEKTNHISKQFEDFDKFKCRTEFETLKKGRIDLLLFNETQAIIIENKVYHVLNNNLEDYWETINKSIPSDNNKVGIVLSLRTEKQINHTHFINIRHIDFLERVLNNLGPYLLKASPTYLVFLKDLYQNIINLSTSAMDPNAIDFFKKHKIELLEAEKFLNNFRNHVKSEVQNACSLLNQIQDEEFLNFNIKSGNYYFGSVRNPNLVFTIGFVNIFNGKNRLTLIVELMGETLANRTIYKQIPFTSSEENIINSEFYFENNKSWAHFAVNRYPVDIIEFENLSQFIADKIIEDDLLSIFNKLDDFLAASKNIIREY